MGNEVINNFNNFCGCIENEESEKSKIEKVSLWIIINKNPNLLNKRFSL